MRTVAAAATLLFTSFQSATAHPSDATVFTDQVAGSDTYLVAESDIYFRAVAAAVAEMTRQWRHIDDSALGTRERTDWRNLVGARSETTVYLPAHFDGFTLTWCDANQLVARYKRLRKAFSILTVSPARIDGDRIRVLVEMQWFSYEKRRALYEISDWANVYFRLDSSKHDYVVDGVELGGI